MNKGIFIPRAVNDPSTKKYFGFVMARLLKIGDKAVGLIGIEAALSELKKVRKNDGLMPEDAAKILLEGIERKNYIPPNARSAYLKALAQLWREETGTTGSQDGQYQSLRILGPDCVGCNRLEEIVRSVLDERGIAADIDHIRDLDEIWRYGVITTPALVIGNRVLCSGRVPTRAQVDIWIRELFQNT